MEAFECTKSKKCAEHYEGTVRDVDYSHNAEQQAQTQCDDCIDQAEQHTVRNYLQRGDHHGGCFPFKRRAIAAPWCRDRLQRRNGRLRCRSCQK